jgi:hypothetical protein
MSDFSDWLQNNLIDLARLAVQCAILATVVSYGRKLLKTLRASQEQVGALLKLSVSGAAAQPPAPAIAEPEPSLEAKSFSSLLPEPLHAPSAASPRSSYSEREYSLGGRVLHEPAGASAVAVEEPPSFTPWVAAPGMDAQQVEPLAPQATQSANRSANWLQAPMRRPGVGPLRRVVRWLQAPAGR